MGVLADRAARLNCGPKRALRAPLFRQSPFDRIARGLNVSDRAGAFDCRAGVFRGLMWERRELAITLDALSPFSVR